jgi:hypothetical protein
MDRRKYLNRLSCKVLLSASWAAWTFESCLYLC